MFRVQLYLYDLSHGQAAALSQSFLGESIEAIWHSSVVVHNQETFFGQGIFTCRPSTSHHGSPTKILDMGTTGIDAGTFRDYIQELRAVYTADKYHLLTFNCNNFSNDVVEFLCGRSIPQDIIDLPKRFLSTPLGASLRPMIESMFTRGGSAPDAQDAVDTLSTQANGHSSGVDSLTSPLTICSNLASFQDLISRNDVLIAMFTKDHCPPCRIIKPVFEDLAFKYAESTPVASTSTLKPMKKIAFVLVDTGLAQPVASRYDIRATPTFLFFSKGKQVHAIKGANQGELTTQCDLIIQQTYPAHPHLQLKLPLLSRLIDSSAAIETPIKFDAALFKFNQFLSTLPEATSLQQTYHDIVVPVLKGEIPLDKAKAAKWIEADQTAFAGLDEESRFPLVDFLRLACLAPEHTLLLLPSVQLLLDFAASHQGTGHLTFMISLRLLTNAAPTLFHNQRTSLTRAAVEGLLHDDSKVKTAAATLAFQLAQLEAQRRVDWQTDPVSDKEEAFETETLSAVLETIRNEDQEPVLHRLFATMGLLVFKSSNAQELEDLFVALDGPDLVEQKSGKLQASDRGLTEELKTLFIS